MKTKSILLLMLMLSSAFPVWGQDSLNLRSIGYIPGNSVVWADSSYLAVNRSVYMPEIGRTFDSLRIYDNRIPDEPEYLGLSFLQFDYLQPNWGEIRDLRQIGGAIIHDDLVIVTHYYASYWGSASPGQSIGPITLQAWDISRRDSAWSVTISDNITEWADPDSGAGEYGYTLPGDLAAVDDILYVAAGSWGLRIYDLSDEEQPILIDTLNYVCQNLAIADDRLVVFTVFTEQQQEQLMLLFDITSPDRPDLIGSINCTESYEWISPTLLNKVSNGIFYFSRLSEEDRRPEVWLFDLAGDDAPQEIARIDLGLTAGLDFRLIASNEALYVWQNSVVHFYSLQNPVEPDWTGAILPDSADLPQLTVAGERLYLGRGASDVFWERPMPVSTIQIYDIGPNEVVDPSRSPFTFYLSPPYPNPFNSSTTISFSLPGSGEAGLRVYDLQGRLVRELVNGRLEAGEHEVVWEANDLPAGIYLVKLQQDKSIATQKIVMLK